MQTEIRKPWFSSEFDSKPGRDDAGQTGVPESEAPGKGERILVIDDHPAWLKLARTMLSDGGFHVQVCQDPRDAVLFLKENPGQIDLVITDLNMPSLNGIELAAELVKINAALPVVLTSVEMIELTWRASDARDSRFSAQALGPLAVVFYYPPSLGEQAV